MTFETTPSQKFGSISLIASEEFDSQGWIALKLVKIILIENSKIPSFGTRESSGGAPIGRSGRVGSKRPKFKPEKQE